VSVKKVKEGLIVLIGAVFVLGCDLSDLVSTGQEAAVPFFSLCFKHRKEFNFDTLYRKDEISIGPEDELTIQINIFDNDENCTSQPVYNYFSSGTFKKVKGASLGQLLGENPVKDETVYMEIELSFNIISTFVEGDVFDALETFTVCGQEVNIFSAINLIEDPDDPQVGLTCKFNDEDQEVVVGPTQLIYFQDTADNNRLFALIRIKF